MANVLTNLKLLKQDMLDNGWKVDSFNFRYKSNNYIVLVEIFDREKDNHIIPKYALVQLHFLQKNDFNKSLVVYANSSEIMINAKSLRDFFNIEWATNLGNILKQFYQCLSEYIPTTVSKNKTQLEKKAICYLLDTSNSRDPNRIYCYAVRRNPVDQDGKLGQRSIFNDNKTRLFRETLYDKLGSDTNLSFKYSLRREDELSDEEIINKWTENRNL